MTKYEFDLEALEEKSKDLLESLPYAAPDTRYFHSKEDFDKAVCKDFIDYVNRKTSLGKEVLIGLSHGVSPSGAYNLIVDRYRDIIRPHLVFYTFVNSPLRRQRDLKDTVDAGRFLKKLLKQEYIKREQILGGYLDRENLEEEVTEFNRDIQEFLESREKEAMDYVFLASDPAGRVAGISRRSEAFSSQEVAILVNDRSEKEITMTPHFLKKSARIAFLATKADKRRPLAWLYYRMGRPDESPSFLRHMENVESRMTVFIDDRALTWPQIEVERTTPHGKTVIRVDMAKPYNENVKKKLPVVLLVHGFLGLNSYDGLLTAIPSHLYVSAAMHYGSIPNDLPTADYSWHVAQNIDAVIQYFGERGHPVYLFDHSMGNIYFLMMDKMAHKLKGIQKYLRGRIGANPFFGEEAKHALLGFLDYVIVPAMSESGFSTEKALIMATRGVLPLDTKRSVRRRGIRLSAFLIRRDSEMRDRIWQAAKERILYMMSNMDSLPHLNRIPIAQALNKLSAKLFAIQIYSALRESRSFDEQETLHFTKEKRIPVLIIKSDKDGVARFVSRIYAGSQAEVMDVTDPEEKDLFREHLYHMVHPHRTSHIIDRFIRHAENSRVEEDIMNQKV